MVSKTPKKGCDWWGQFTPTFSSWENCGVGPHQRFGNAELVDGSHHKLMGFLELVAVELTHGFFGSHMLTHVNHPDLGESMAPPKGDLF